MQEMSEDERKEAVKEANTLQMLQHKNIIKYHEHYKTKKGRLCIVMEYAAGKQKTITSVFAIVAVNERKHKYFLCEYSDV